MSFNLFTFIYVLILLNSTSLIKSKSDKLLTISNSNSLEDKGKVSVNTFSLLKSKNKYLDENISLINKIDRFQESASSTLNELFKMSFIPQNVLVINQSFFSIKTNENIDNNNTLIIFSIKNPENEDKNEIVFQDYYQNSVLESFAYGNYIVLLFGNIDTSGSLLQEILMFNPFNNKFSKKSISDLKIKIISNSIITKQGYIMFFGVDFSISEQNTSLYSYNLFNHDLKSEEVLHDQLTFLAIDYSIDDRIYCLIKDEYSIDLKYLNLKEDNKKFILVKKSYIPYQEKDENNILTKTLIVENLIYTSVLKLSKSKENIILSMISYDTITKITEKVFTKKFDNTNAIFNENYIDMSFWRGDFIISYNYTVYFLNAKIPLNCPNDCTTKNNQGKCNSKYCECSKSFFGIDCSKSFLCDKECFNGNICGIDNECECKYIISKQESQSKCYYKDNKVCLEPTNDDLQRCICQEGFIGSNCNMISPDKEFSDDLDTTSLLNISTKVYSMSNNKIKNGDSNNNFLKNKRVEDLYGIKLVKNVTTEDGQNITIVKTLNKFNMVKSPETLEKLEENKKLIILKGDKEYVSTSDCKFDCHGKGVCFNSACYCNQGYTGKTCEKTVKREISEGYRIQNFIFYFILSLVASSILTLMVLIYLK